MYKYHIYFFVIIFLIVILIYHNKISIIQDTFENKMGPNIIQTWKTNEIPNEYKSFVKNIKKLNTNSRYIFFNDNYI